MSEDRATRRKELFEAVRAVQANAQSIIATMSKGTRKLSDAADVQIKGMPLGGEYVTFAVTLTGPGSDRPGVGDLLQNLYANVAGWSVLPGVINVFAGDTRGVFRVELVW